MKLLLSAFCRKEIVLRAILGFAPLLMACGESAIPAGEPGKLSAHPSEGIERPGDPRWVPETLEAGRWSPAPPGAPSVGGAIDADLERLNALGYAAGVRQAPALRSVTRHDPDRASPGYNFYTSGHGTEALLMDMEGRVLHRWAYDYNRLWPGLDVPPDALGRVNWRRAHLFVNGDILAIHEGIGMIKLDKDSNLLWEYPERAHHDVHVAADGTIYVLIRVARIIPEINPGKLSIEDYVATLTPDGRELRRVSILRSLVNGGEEDLISRIWPREGDLLHTNSLEILDGSLADRLPAFAAGRALISFRHLDAIAVIDLAVARSVWSHTGSFRAPHHPTVLENGNLLLFDNIGPGNEVSAVYEIDPLSGAHAWEYRGSRDAPFYSWSCGSAYRLPNGNTLITESDGGRAIEVTPEGEIVWEFFNPDRAGEELEYIATLFDLQRFQPSYGFDWLELPEDP